MLSERFYGVINMLFSSITFIYLFLPLVLFLNYVVFKKNRTRQNTALLVASLAFYAWGEPVFVFVMIASIVVNWLLGLKIDKAREDGKKARVFLILAIAFNLGLLFVFKYLAFTLEVIKRLSDARWPVPTIALPIGISFFTFQAMSYVIDVYRGKGKAQSDLLCVGLYISFFPQLIAGPIVRYETIAEEITGRTESLDDLFDGFARFVVGLSKKVLLANSFAILADQAFAAVTNGSGFSVVFGWLGAVSYTLQIFFDFSGYSDMAIGLGRMFGFHFLENFNYPYISTSITDFWRRWHMSLGTWFRDYLYIPLGGSRSGKRRQILNLFIVWLLTGLWHGANFTFIAWGLMYFVLLAVEKSTGFHKKQGAVLNIFKWLYTIVFVVIGWVLFRSDSIADAVIYLRAMFGLNGNPFCDTVAASWLSQYKLTLALGVFFSTPLLKNAFQKWKNNNACNVIKAFGLIAVFVLSVASLVSSAYNPFIYFNF